MSDLIIFDLDNTLLNGDSDRDWGIYLAEKNIVDADYLKRSEKFYDNYYSGNLDIHGFLNFCVEPLKNNSMELLLETRKAFIEEKIKPIVLEKGFSAVANELNNNNNKVIIATATNSFVTRPIADLFGVKDLIATEFEVIDNKFTGKVLGAPCFQEGKVSKVIDWINANGCNLSSTTFYSDSFNDLPLLKKVNTAIIVDGDDKLIEEANNNGWDCISFR
jgi:HAD superfamily hydrolase (TIGR01490 family)